MLALLFSTIVILAIYTVYAPDILMTFLSVIGSLTNTVLFSIILLTFPLVALIICGVFSCPTDESFRFWLTNYINTAIYDEHQNQENSWFSYFNKQLRKTTYSRLVLTKMNPKFFHCGAFKLVICSDNKEEMYIIGVFNTWVPLK